ncbi:hypothetical protein COO60DRAFT_1542045 [Scenedesmus sp. NREL 46B-D3]|nr:hypothetical protein COO60DRAFT_1542045 [Scenedesmus sp. NREL 46B-D3]
MIQQCLAAAAVCASLQNMHTHSLRAHYWVAAVPGAAAGPGPSAYGLPLVLWSALLSSMPNVLLMPVCRGLVVAGDPPSSAGKVNRMPVRNSDATARKATMLSPSSFLLRGALGGRARRFFWFLLLLLVPGFAARCMLAAFFLVTPVAPLLLSLSRNAVTCRDALLLVKGLTQAGLLPAAGLNAAVARVLSIMAIMLLMYTSLSTLERSGWLRWASAEICRAESSLNNLSI